MKIRDWSELDSLIEIYVDISYAIDRLPRYGADLELAELEKRQAQCKRAIHSLVRSYSTEA